MISPNSKTTARIQKTLLLRVSMEIRQLGVESPSFYSNQSGEKEEGEEEQEEEVGRSPVACWVRYVVEREREKQKSEGKEKEGIELFEPREAAEADPLRERKGISSI